MREKKRIVMILEIWYYTFLEHARVICLLWKSVLWLFYKPTYERSEPIKARWNFNFSQFLVGEPNMHVCTRACTHAHSHTPTHTREMKGQQSRFVKYCFGSIFLRGYLLPGLSLLCQPAASSKISQSLARELHMVVPKRYNLCT